MTMPELPHVQGLPSCHDTDYWGPYVEACCDEDMVMRSTSVFVQKRSLR